MRTPYATTRQVANEYLVRERDRRRWRELALVVLVLAPVGLALMGYTWISLAVLDTGYRIDELERQRHELSRRERELHLEVSYLTRPQQVERRAIEELGMHAPELDQVIFAGGGP